MAWAVEEVTSLARVQVEEDAWNDNNAFFKTGLEEVQAVGDSGREASKVEPEVKGRVGNILDNKSHLAETLNNIVSLHLFSVS